MDAPSYCDGFNTHHNGTLRCRREGHPRHQQSLLAGKKAELIAGQLGVSPVTVTTYRKRAYDKLGIASRGALFALCRQE
ncbi:helix-turn-helix transcriptional regulator [Thioclava sp. 15-R06ZXC-3]|uniref:Helix-turn-helix transcriptional regulator n=1 Tax=Thioclava arctica TaxID=3238301 RepID=A0ABV3TNJ4_9RHOB